MANTGVKLPYFKISRLKLHKSRSKHEDGDQDGMIRESRVIEVNIITVTLKYNRKDMRYRTGKTRSYTSKRKDNKVTNKNSANTFESELQPA